MAQTSWIGTRALAGSQRKKRCRQPERLSASFVQGGALPRAAPLLAQGDPLTPLDGTTYTTPHTHTLLATPHIALHLLACMHTIHHQACCVCMPVSMLLCLHSCVHAVSAPLPCITLAMSVCLLVLLSAVVGSFITTPLNQSDHTQSHRATHSHTHRPHSHSHTLSLLHCNTPTRL